MFGVKNFLFLFFFLLLAISVFANDITLSNYQKFIGKKIKFADTLSKGQYYRVARKKLSSKKYANKTGVINDIQLDKKKNFIIFITVKFDNGKDKQIKIKTKTNNVKLENISVLWPPAPKKTTPKTSRTKKPATRKFSPIVPENIQNFINSTASSSESSSLETNSIFLFLLLLLVFLLVLKAKINRKKKFHSGFLFTSKGSSKNSDFSHHDTYDSPHFFSQGESSELDLIFKLQKADFPTENIFHNLYIPTRSNTFSQIDVLLITNIGLIVFEVKDYSGWIFGNGKQNQWTQVLNYGKEKYRFYNPIKQNQQHINRLKTYLRRNIPYFSVIVFYGDCELKDISFIPKNTYITTPHCVGLVLEKLLQENSPFSFPENMLPLLKRAVNYGSLPEIRQKHINNIHDMLGEDRLFR